MSQRLDRETRPRTPRWVILLGIVALILVLLVGFILITGLGGPHGPGRHEPSGGAALPWAALALTQTPGDPMFLLRLSEALART
jgi:hypothetical protein